MDKLIKKNFNIALAEAKGIQSQYRLEMFATASIGFKKEFLRNTKPLLTHGQTIELQLNALNHTHSRSSVDCIWEKCRTVGTETNDEEISSNKADTIKKLEDLEKSSSQIKHIVPEIINFRTENNFGTFIKTQHSVVFKLSLDFTNAQFNCDECFPCIESVIHSHKFKYIEEGTVLFEQSVDETSNQQTVGFNIVS